MDDLIQKNENDDLRELIDVMNPQLKSVYFSTQTADAIYSANQESGIPEDYYSSSAFLVGDVLLGILNPSDLPKELTMMGIPEGPAMNFYRIISQLLFLKIQPELQELYGSGQKITPAPARPAEKIEVRVEPPLERIVPPEIRPADFKPLEVPPLKPEFKTPPSPASTPSAPIQPATQSKDVYRESIDESDSSGTINLKSF